MPHLGVPLDEEEEPTFAVGETDGEEEDLTPEEVEETLRELEELAELEELDELDDSPDEE